MADPQTTKPIELFYSYSHKDEKLREKLETHLALLKRQGVIAGWHDRKIGAGQEWANQVDKHLNSAQIILLLVSADFLASDYCYEVELKRALERHDAREARVIPVILRPCDWHLAPFGKLQALPRDGKPIANWSSRENAFLDVAQGIRNAAEALPQKPLDASPNVANSLLERLWRVPPHKRNFVGRGALLDQIHTLLASGDPVVLHALGGMGKTRLAAEYVHVYASEYQHVFWLRSEDPDTLSADCATLAGMLEPYSQDTDLLGGKPAFRAVLDWLSQNSPYLLVFDNALNATAILEYLPQDRDSHVLITSQNPNWREMAVTVPIPVLPTYAAAELLLLRTGQSAKRDAASLAEEMGCLPLALTQAAAYIEETQIPFGRYLNLFRQVHRDLWAKEPPPDDYHATVSTTWRLALDRIQETSQLAVALLNLIAFLAPEDIPHDLLRMGMQPSSELDFIDAIRRLRTYSLIEIAEDTVSVHRLVQLVTRDRLDEVAKKQYAEKAVTLIKEACSSALKEDHPKPSRLVAHAHAATALATPLGVAQALISFLKLLISVKIPFSTLDDNLIVELAQAGRRDATEYLIFKYRQALTRHMAAETNYTKEDLSQEVAVGIIQAINKFDVRKGIHFGAFARHVIAQASIRSKSVTKASLDLPDSEHPSQWIQPSIFNGPDGGLSNEEVLSEIFDILSRSSSGDPDNLEEIVIRNVERFELDKRRQEFIDTCSGQLSAAEMSILVSMHYGRSLNEIAEELKCSRSRIHLMFQRIRRKLTSIISSF